jgi:four helix bundle protein
VNARDKKKDSESEKQWRKRRCEAAFISKLSDAETEAAETQVHVEFASHHGYVSDEQFREIYDAYEKICAQIVRMIEQPQKWLIQRKDNEEG